jgi:transposase-like protein
MDNVLKLIKWLAAKFTRDQLWEIVSVLINVLNDHYDDIKPRNDFLDKHPNYRKFKVDPLAPLEYSQVIAKQPQLDYMALLDEYEAKYNKPLKPVQIRDNANKVPQSIRCAHCDAPAEFLYYNDGKKRSQILCKVCKNTFTPGKRYTRKTKYLCPYCHKSLFLWKDQSDVSYYKCANKNCAHRIRELGKLNENEKKLRQTNPEHFKINYQYRDYHYNIADLNTATPQDKPKVDLNKIHNDMYTFCLVLTLHISYAITARKTAHMLQNIFGIKISYQTVLNYVETAAYYLHHFNQTYKGDVDSHVAGDETYIKQQGLWHYVWLMISAKSRKIVGYNYSDNRSVKPAIAVMLDVLKTAAKDQKFIFIVDGNPSYQAAAHYINKQNNLLKIDIKKVIGLENMDDESQTYRHFKQIIERLNRTFKYHTQYQNGFGSTNGAISKLVCFVTYYNFMRPHKSLNYKTPVVLDELDGIDLIQDKWKKVISMAA